MPAPALKIRNDAGEWVTIAGGTADLSNHISNDGTDHIDVVLNNADRHTQNTDTSQGIQDADLDMGFNDINNVKDYEAPLDQAGIAAFTTDAHWTLDETLLDSSGNGHTLVKTAGTTAYDCRGFSKCLIGNGTTYWDSTSYKGPIGSAGSYPATTIAFNIRTLQTSTDNIMVFGDTGTAGKRMQIRINPGTVGDAGSLQLTFGNGNVAPNIAINDGEWHNFIVSIAGGATGTLYTSFIFYVDGVKYDDATLNISYPIGESDSFTPETGIDVRVGADQSGTNILDESCLDELVILNGTAVNDTQAATLYTAMRNRTLYMDGDIRVSRAKVCGTLEHTGHLAGFYGATPVAQAAALTTQLTSLTIAGSSTPDYSPFVTNTGPYGLSTEDEFETLLEVVFNLQDRVQELEDAFSEAAGGNGLIA